MKVCFAASSGGHWEELLCLKKIADGNETFYVTEEGGQTSDFSTEHLYAFPKIDRGERFFFVHFVRLFFKAIKVIRKEKPDVIISTGALVSFPFCLLTKLRGGKVIFIESFARVNDPSLTGKLVYKFADLFLVQWKPMLKIYPKAKYVGGIF